MLQSIYLALIGGFLVYQALAGDVELPGGKWLMCGMGALALLLAGNYLIRVSCLDEPRRLTARVVLRRWSRIRIGRRGLFVVIVTMIALAVPGLVFWSANSLFDWFPQLSNADAVFVGSLGFFTASSVGLVAWDRMRGASHRLTAREVLQDDRPLQKSMSKARSFDVVAAMSRLVVETDRPLEDVRAAITL
jgi:hypothetical protein